MFSYIRFIYFILLCLSLEVYSKDIYQINRDIADGSLNIRDNQNFSSKVVGSIKESVYVYPESVDGDWFSVKTASNKKLWMYSGKNNKYASKVDSKKVNFTVANNFIQDNISIFNIPGSSWEKCPTQPNCKALAWLKKGQALDVIGSKLVPVPSLYNISEPKLQLYYEIKTKNGTGFISSDFVRNGFLMSVAEPCLDATGPPVKNKPIIVISKVLSLKEDPIVTEEKKPTPTKKKETSDKLVLDIEPVCSWKNNYFEKTLKNNAVANQNPDTRFPVKCIKEAMEMKGKTVNLSFDGGFRSCTEDGRWIQKTTKHAPCQTSRYIKLVHNTFTKVMNCMDIPYKDIFPLFLIESNFHVNSMSKSGAEGLGHFTNGALNTVNNAYYSNYINKLKKHKSSECKQMANKVKKLTNSGKCSLVQIPNNPLSGFIYSAITWKENKRDLATEMGNHLPESSELISMKTLIVEKEKKIKKLHKEATRTSRKNQILIRKSLREANVELTKLQESIKDLQLHRIEKDTNLNKILNELSLYAHNWGLKGIKDIYNEFMIDRKDAFISFNEFKGPNGEFMNYYKSLKTSSRSRQEEKANYVYKTIPFKLKKDKNGNKLNANGSQNPMHDWVQKVNKKVKGDKSCGNF